MSIFTSKREKHLWIWAFTILVIIFSTLFIGRPLANLFESQDRQAVVFVLGMLLVGISILIHAFKKNPSKTEMGLMLGIIAVYLMLFLRLGLAERSHLIEYSILAIFIHRIINERIFNGKAIRIPTLLAFAIAFVIGVIDECLQIFLPDRVFDPIDILFNGFVIFMALGSYVAISFARNHLSKSKKDA